MAVACHSEALSKVAIIGSAEDVPIGSNDHVATSQRTKVGSSTKQPGLITRQGAARCLSSLCTDVYHSVNTKTQPVSNANPAMATVRGNRCRSTFYLKGKNNH